MVRIHSPRPFIPASRLYGALRQQWGQLASGSSESSGTRTPAVIRSSILVWNPSVIPLLRVNLHIATISCDQEANVCPSAASGASPACRSSEMAPGSRGIISEANNTAVV